MEQLLVLYGSQTGTARDVAERVGRLGLRLRIPRVRVMSFKDHLSLVHELVPKLVPPPGARDKTSPPGDHPVRPPGLFLICVCATTGHGEEPDNMKAYWRFLLRKSLPKTSLCGEPGALCSGPTRFGVFGLGDSTYPKYNFVAKKLHKRLLQLGGECAVNLGLADDQHPKGPDGALEPWLDEMESALLQYCPLAPGKVRVPADSLLPPRIAVVRSDSTKSAPVPTGCFFPAVLRTNRRLTPLDHFRFKAGSKFTPARPARTLV